MRIAGVVDPALAGEATSTHSASRSPRRSESARRRAHARTAGTVLADLAVMAKPDPGPAGIQSRSVAISRLAKWHVSLARLKGFRDTAW